MAIEHLLATLTEGTTLRIERSDGGITDLPGERVAGTLGIVSRGIRKRKHRRNATMPTEFGMNLLLARCAGFKSARKEAIAKCSEIAWRLFWKEPGNETARIRKDTFRRVARLAVDDFCTPGLFQSMKAADLEEILKINHKTYNQRYSSVYGQLQTEISRAEYAVREAFWRNFA